MINIYLESNQIVDFNPIKALSNTLQQIVLVENQLEQFNPTIPLPTGLQYLYLSNNKMTTEGYKNSEPWANSLPINTGLLIGFFGNYDSPKGTNLETILQSKLLQLYY